MRDVVEQLLLVCTKIGLVLVWHVAFGAFWLDQSICIVEGNSILPHCVRNGTRTGTCHTIHTMNENWFVWLHIVINHTVHLLEMISDGVESILQHRKGNRFDRRVLQSILHLTAVYNEGNVKIVEQLLILTNSQGSFELLRVFQRRDPFGSKTHYSWCVGMRMDLVV